MSLRIALIMMQKNETLLLDPWLRYHEAMISAQSIFIFDNGSSDPHTLATLKAAEGRGVTVSRKYNQLQDYPASGTIAAELINHLDRDNPHDFYFPIDCDEFLACKINGQISCSRDDLDRSLIDFIGNQKVLTIPRKYVNSPYHRNRYSEISFCKKCFFAQGACQSLAFGYHEGTSKAGGGEAETNITYIEFHYKPYQEHLRLSQQKIDYIVINPSRRALAAYIKAQRNNTHAAMALLESEYSYLQTLKNQPNTIMDFSLLQRLEELGVDVRKLFSDSNVKSLQFQINIMAQHYYQKTIDSADEAIFILRSMAGRIKRSILSYIQ
jgi:hypothetical protein